jgi:hypothetical protein
MPKQHAHFVELQKNIFGQKQKGKVRQNHELERKGYFMIFAYGQYVYLDQGMYGCRV